MNEAVVERPGNPDTAKIIYVLYLVGLAAGITSVVGVVMAYVNREDGPDWLRTHYDLQIRTFWMMLLYVTLSGILCLLLIGFALLIVVAVWWIVRCVKGLKYVELKEPYPNHLGWGF